MLSLWLCETREGLAAMEGAAIVPRQNGKGGCLEALALDSLFLAKMPLTIWTAHLFKTAHEAYQRLAALIKVDPLLDRKVQSYYQSAQRLAIVLKTGPRIEFVARSLGSGRGLSAPRVILDEAMFLTDVQMGALFPTMAAQSMRADMPQLIYTGSAGFDTSAVLHRVRRRVQGTDERLAFAEWSVDPQEYNPASVQDWAMANPALGIRISADYIEGERNALPAAEFTRERLGVFDPEPSDVGELAIPADAWSTSFDGRSTVAGQSTFALDVGPKGMAALAVAGLRADGLVHVEILEHREPGPWIIDRAAALCERWGAQLVLDPAGGAGAFMPDLTAAGVSVVPLGRRDVISACGRFRHLIVSNGMRHLGSGELEAAVATVVYRRIGEAFVWNTRTVAAPDLSPLYAVTLAAWPQDAAKPRSILSF